VHLSVEMAIERLKVTSNPSGTDQGRGVEQFAMRSINLFILFGIRKNFLRKGRSQLLCLFIRRQIKQNVVTTEAYLQNFIQHPAIKVNSKCTGNYWGSPAWLWMQQFNC